MGKSADESLGEWSLGGEASSNWPKRREISKKKIKRIAKNSKGGQGGEVEDKTEVHDVETTNTI